MKTTRAHSTLEILETRIAPATLELVGGLLTYIAGAGVANALTVVLSGGSYEFLDSGETITLGAGTAGFTGGGTNTVTGPAAGVTSIVVLLGDLNDTFTTGAISHPLNADLGAGTGDVINAGNISVNGALSLDAETINLSGAITAATNVTLSADTLGVVANVNMTGTAIIRPETSGRAINLGTETAGSLSLTDAELDRFVGATLIRVGSKVAGTITLSAAITSSAGALSLQSDAGLTQVGAGAITVAALAVDMDATAFFSAACDIDTLALRLSDAGADFFFADPDGFQIGTVDGLTGLATSTDAGSFIALNGGSVTQAAGAAIVSGGLRLSGSANYTLTDPANDVGTLAANPSGTINFTDANALTVGTVSAVSGVTSTSGGVRLTTLAGGLTISNGDTSTAPDVFASDDVFLTSGVAGSDFGITIAANAGISAINEIVLTADAMSIGATVASTSSFVSLDAFEDATTIALGGTDAAGVLGLSDAELDFIVSSSLFIASPGPNPITVTGTISPVGLTGFLQLGGGDVSGTGGIVVGQLNLTGGNISLTGANDVNGLGFPFVGLSGQIINFADADGFTLNNTGFEPADFTLATFTGSTITLTTQLNLTLGGTTPGTNQDQIAVVGSTALGGGLSLNAVGTLAQGTTFVLVSNDGSDAITGTFTGLPEGAALTVGGAPGTISYVGGDGNDVVFTTLPGLTITLANGGKTATFRDVDGDLVTVKTTRGAFDGSEFIGIVDGIAGGGQLRRLTLDADFKGANITITAKRTAEGGNGFVNIGFLDAAGVDLGAVTIAGDLGRLDAGTVGGDARVPGVKSLTVQSGGLLGTSTQAAGGLSRVNIEGALPKLAVKGDVRTDIFINGTDGKLGVATIGGSLVHFSSASAINLFAQGGIGSVKIGGDVRSTAVASFAGIASGGAIGSIAVGGSIVGAPGFSVQITAFGKLTAPTAGLDLAIGSITVKGSVEATEIIAGLSGTFNADASIGSIAVGGDWIASRVTAGTTAGADNQTGTADDAKLTGAAVRDNAAIFSTIGSFTVKGQAFGTATSTSDMFGVVAERIGKAKVGGRTFAFVADKGATLNREAFFAAPTLDGDGAENPMFDFTIREIGSTTPAGTVTGGVNFQLSADGKTATFNDVDGDLVTVKRSVGAFAANGTDFNIDTAASGGGSLVALSSDTAPGNLSVTARPGPDGGNGRVNVDNFATSGIDLGHVSIAGDLKFFSASNAGPAPVVKSLKVHSHSQLSAGGAITITGTLSKLSVATDVRGRVDVTGVLGSATLGGSLIGGSGDFSGRLFATDSIGAVKIGGAVRSGAGANSGQISTTGGALGAVSVGGDLVGTVARPVLIYGFGQPTEPATGLDLAIKSLSVKGSVENARIGAGTNDGNTNADAAIGAVSVGRAWLASNLLAGVNDGADNFFGTADDIKAVPFPGDPLRDVDTRFSTIASILIEGQALGSAAAGDAFGIVAEQIGKAQIGTRVFKFDKGERDAADAFAAAPTGPGPAPDNATSDFFLREITI